MNVIYVDPSGFVITNDGEKLSGRGPDPETWQEPQPKVQIPSFKVVP